MDSPEDFFAGNPAGLAAFQKVRSMIDALGPYDVRITSSQIAFRRRRGFAYLWQPGQYLARPQAAVVLSIALRRRDPSERVKEVVQPAPGHWMHHLEVHHLDDLDEQVQAWLQESADNATS